MPFVKPRHRRALIALAALAATAAMPAVASASVCSNAGTAKTFKAFGDLADYSLAPGGAFEGGAAGWTLTGASTVSGNESYKVHGSGDTSALAVQATGQAISPAFCVSVAEPTFRFFARRTSGTGGVLRVLVRWTDSNGVTHDSPAGTVLGGDTSWHPSPVMALGLALPLPELSRTASVRLIFDPDANGGAWAIDDVYIDPYSR